MLQVEEQPFGTKQCKNFAIKLLFARIGEVVNGETTDYDVKWCVSCVFFSDRRPVREAEIALAASSIGSELSMNSPLAFG